MMCNINLPGRDASYLSDLQSVRYVEIESNTSFAKKYPVSKMR